ncbi:phosphoribosyl 1,2-cyclic phosphodiesterase [Salsuginibacillus halophilus]|uniref:Phosphoribosyl 1,2-cyclic phosphodiesterase n=1 Tax=Salsuginibacillus halophilus TaxID=517424 RepID=A0A2P8HI59_9BACI|nr:MBL fold metallo-hydrolase [Salsuginibacillus halophilus]PSL45912.1 phosphoribosyl 1,2-cyclic phosphodiesterase [Salsuginibacillus halophilus]
MGLNMSVLASGSTGNAVYVETSRQRLLIDAGLSGKKIEALLQDVGRRPADLDGLLISHEHSDHIKGAGVLARKHRLPIYANEKTWQAMTDSIGPIPLDQKFTLEANECALFGDIDIETFSVSHDAADPMFFVFHHEGRKLALATDMGYVSEQIKSKVQNADALIFEANHDLNMLRMGRYPWNVKRRILGDRGHVSNEDAGKALADIIGERTQAVYLAHLSKDNNMKDLARMTVEQTLATRGFDAGSAPLLFDTDPDRPSTLTAV